MKKALLVTILVYNSFIIIGQIKIETSKTENIYGNETEKYFTKLDVVRDVNEIYKKTKEVYPYYTNSMDSLIIIKKESIINSVKDSITALEFYYHLEEMLCYLDDYHTQIRGVLRTTSGCLSPKDNVFPLILNFKKGKAFFKLDLYNSKIPLESEIISINEISIKEIIQKSKSLLDYKFSTEEKFNYEFSSYQNIDEFSNTLSYLAIKSPYSICYKDGKTDSIKNKILQETTREYLRYDYYIYLKERLKKEDFVPFEYNRLDKETAILTVNTFVKKNIILALLGYNSISKKKLRKALAKIKNDNYSNLIIDLRNNSGGHLEVIYTILDNIIKGDYAIHDKIFSPSFLAMDSKKSYAQIRNGLIKSYGFSRSKANEYTKKYFLLASKTKPIEKISISQIIGDKKRRNKIKKQFNGNVYFLIGKGCYSSTIELLDIAKFHNIGLLIGENTEANIGVTSHDVWIYKHIGMDTRVRGCGTIPMNKIDNPLSPLQPHIHHTDSLIDFTQKLIKKGITIKNYETINQL